MERPRGVGKGPDFRLMVVVVVVVAVVVAWPVERSGAAPKIRTVLQNEAPPLPFSDLLSSPFFPICQGSQLQHVKRLRGDSNPGHIQKAHVGYRPTIRTHQFIGFKWQAHFKWHLRSYWPLTFSWHRASWLPSSESHFLPHTTKRNPPPLLSPLGGFMSI